MNAARLRKNCSEETRARLRMACKRQPIRWANKSPEDVVAHMRKMRVAQNKTPEKVAEHMSRMRAPKKDHLTEKDQSRDAPFSAKTLRIGGREKAATQSIAKGLRGSPTKETNAEE